MKKYWIKDLTEKQCIHAPTREIADKLRVKFDELGLKYIDGDSYQEMQKMMSSDHKHRVAI